MPASPLRNENALGKLLIDRRAHRLIDVELHPEQALSTKELLRGSASACSSWRSVERAATARNLSA